MFVLEIIHHARSCESVVVAVKTFHRVLCDSLFVLSNLSPASNKCIFLCNEILIQCIDMLFLLSEVLLQISNKRFSLSNMQYM